MKTELGGLAAALSTFTIIPMPTFKIDEKSFGRSLVWLPVAGVVIGSLWSAGAYACLMLQHAGVFPLLCMVLCAAIPMVLSGFIHLDGFMDCCDALLSRRTCEEKIRILKDPNCGPFAVICILLLAGLFAPAVGAIMQLNGVFYILAAIPVISRSLAVLTLLCSPILKSSSLAAASLALRKKWDKPLQCLFIVVALAFAGLGAGMWAAVALSLAMLPFALALRCCKNQLGGVNGDVAGFVNVIYEISACALCAVLGGIFA